MRKCATYALSLTCVVRVVVPSIIIWSPCEAKKINCSFKNFLDLEAHHDVEDTFSIRARWLSAANLIFCNFSLSRFLRRLHLWNRRRAGPLVELTSSIAGSSPSYTKVWSHFMFISVNFQNKSFKNGPFWASFSLIFSLFANKKQYLIHV